MWVVRFGGGVVAVMAGFCERCCGATGLLDPGSYQRIVLQCNGNRKSVDGDCVSDGLRRVIPLVARILLRGNESGHMSLCAGPCFVGCGGVA